jgi:uncharacterized protein DUF4115
MAGQSDQPPDTGTTAVPDLIERYRLRRDAWIAQADELARLRDEVRGSAEREAMEIVTAARRDVRKVIMEARRELLVLSAQVQAALGEAHAKTDPATLLNKAGITSEAAARNALAATAPESLVPEDAVNEILNEVHEDMAALAEDARALPLQAVPPRQITASAPAPPPIETIAQPSVSSAPSIVGSAPSIAPESPIRFPDSLVPPLDPVSHSGLSESASKVLLSSPFPSEAVPVQSDKRFRIFVALFVGVGATVAGVTMWWLSSGNASRASSAAATPAASEASAPVAGEVSGPASADEGSTSPTRATGTANLSVVAQAVRDVWIRTTVDGQTDGGRTLAAGQSIDVSAEQSISLRVGDAGAIVVSVNNGEKRPLGRDGQVITRQFFVEAAPGPARTPAAQPAPAPSAPSAPPTPPRALPPVASAAPATPPRTAMPSRIPSPIGSTATANSPAPPPPVVPPPPAASPVAGNTPQVVVPSGVVNQLSAPAAPLAAPATAPATASPATVVVAVARQWLDAYHRQDRAALAALSTENLLLADERRADERFPSGLNDVTRTLDRVSVQIAADTAVLTAVMMEQSNSLASSPHVSPISQVWVLGGGQWKVRQARFVSEARLNSVFK